ncbi:hypothetical protein FALCPG4_001822 [Fusarium falciforme]
MITFDQALETRLSMEARAPVIALVRDPEFMVIQHPASKGGRIHGPRRFHTQPTPETVAVDPRHGSAIQLPPVWMGHLPGSHSPSLSSQVESRLPEPLDPGWQWIMETADLLETSST